MFKDSILRLTAIFGCGSIESVVIYYYPCGPKQVEGFMNNGKNEGYWTYWDLDGIVIKKECYKNVEIVH